MTLWQDVRFGIHGMLKARGMAAIALLTLALGIGANTAIFSIVNAVLLRPLPFHDPGQLVQLRADMPRLGTSNVGFSYPEFEDLRDRAGIFSSLSLTGASPANLTGGQHPARVELVGVSTTYFDLLGAKPQLGRLFDQRDTAEGFAEACVISDGFWRRVFGAEPNVVDRKVRVDNDLYTIVGVLAPSFHHPAPAASRPVDIWLSAGFRGAPFPPPARDARGLEIIGRLKPGITMQQAQSRLTSLASNLRRDYPADYPATAGWIPAVQPLKEVVVGNSQKLLFSLLLAVTLVLLIGCVNVAGLLLARASVRRREMAVRMALGASRVRVVRQLLTESAVLGVAAGVLGFLTAFVTEKALVRLLPLQLPRMDEISIDLRVLLFTLFVSLLTSVLFGLAPALQTSRPDVNALKQDGRGGEASLGSNRIRKLLVASEIALALMLVVGAGLLLRTFWGLLRVDPGFAAGHVLAASSWLPYPNDPATDIYASNEQRTVFIREVVRRLEQVPGVQQAGFASALPLRTPLVPAGFIVEGISEPGDAPTAIRINVSPSFLSTLGVPLIRGRMLQETDDDKADRAVLVDQNAVRSLWHGQDPIGRRVRYAAARALGGKMQAPRWMTVVGVVGNIKYGQLDEVDTPHIYASAYQNSARIFSVVVRGVGDTGALSRSISREIQSVDTNLPVSEASLMTEVVTASLADRRLATTLIAIFAALALGLAAVGVYGVASYMVAQRTREFGIRSALGATAGDLLRLVLRDSIRPLAVGLAAGVLGALLGGRIIASFLFGVRSTDPVVFVLSAVVLVMIGLAANYVPARRAGRVDPNIALRCE